MAPENGRRTSDRPHAGGPDPAGRPRLDADSYVSFLCTSTPRSHEVRGTSPEEVTQWQQRFRPILRQLLGLDAIAERGTCDLAPELHSTETFDDHIREEWTIESEPDFRFPFYLLRPREARAVEAPAAEAEPRPLVITPHGHGKSGKRVYVGIADTDSDREQIEDGERDIALQAVRQGYVAIAPDMRAFAGLRRAHERERDHTCSCRTMQMHALLFGRTLVGERVHDVSRLIDFAATQPGIDTSRVAISGNSGGGTVTLFAAACDERITVAVPGSYFCTFEHSIGSIYHCECNYVPGILRHGEMWDVAGLIAPRPFLAVAGTEDPIFPVDAVRSSFARLEEIYRAAGAAASCRLSINEGGHRYYKRDVWPFIARSFAAAGRTGEPKNRYDSDSAHDRTHGRPHGGAGS